jgi:hypothetical protein
MPDLRDKYQGRTPAMALGLTARVLTVGDSLRTLLAPTATWVVLPGTPKSGNRGQADSANPSICPV